MVLISAKEACNIADSPLKTRMQLYVKRVYKPCILKAAENGKHSVRIYEMEYEERINYIKYWLEYYGYTVKIIQMATFDWIMEVQW